MPRPLIDLTGHTFGRLTVVERAQRPAHITHSSGSAWWTCICSCGSTVAARSEDLRRGNNKSCGCLKYEHMNLSGQTFGRLTVVREVPRPTHVTTYGHYWLCVCGCGDSVVVPTKNLQSTNTRSCGCLRNEAFGNRWRTHGLSRTPEYVRMAEQKRRAIQVGNGAVDDITIGALIERDGPECALCGGDTSGHTHPHRQSATIGHIVPLARGGTHTFDNVRVEHLACNVSKGTQTDEELLAREDFRYHPIPRFPRLWQWYKEHTDARWAAMLAKGCE